MPGFVVTEIARSLGQTFSLSHLSPLPDDTYTNSVLLLGTERAFWYDDYGVAPCRHPRALSACSA